MAAPEESHIHGREECISQLDGQTLVAGSRLITLLDSTATTPIPVHALYGTSAFIAEAACLEPAAAIQGYLAYKKTHPFRTPP